MKYIEALQDYTGEAKSLFLAGGITGCPDWQKAMVASLKQTSLVIFNPRRATFPIDDPNAAAEQITWEHFYLGKATAISFWFPSETLCPIVLFELGAWTMTNKKLFVGCHPNYQRKRDVYLQTKLVRPDVQIVESLGELALAIRAWA